MEHKFKTDWAMIGCGFFLFGVPILGAIASIFI